MARRTSRDIALTIAGSDSGGGAGIQADLHTFSALGLHGTSAITCLTAQNPKGVTGVQAAEPGMVTRQLAALFAELPPKAAKTGMLFSAGIIEEVVDFWRQGRRPPLVVDPVMVATSGARLLQPDAIALMKDALFPLAELITPNLDEAEVLLGTSIREPEDLREAARLLSDRHGCAVLVKGGHLRGLQEAIDILRDPVSGSELLLTAPYLRGISTHGTGCTYSAAIAGYRAGGCTLLEAVRKAKTFISTAIAQSCGAGRHTVLNWTA